MDRYLVCILFISISRSVIAETDLVQQNDDQIDPINEYNYDNLNKDQDKRTIFGKTHGIAKHVGVHPSGFKYVLGYGAVDLKYLPVLRPFSVRPHGFRPHFPRLQYGKPFAFRPIKRPGDGWRPIPKPVIPPHIPLPPHLLTKPWEQEGWHHGEPTNFRPVIPIPPPPEPSPPAIPVQPAVPAKPVFPVHPQVPPSPVVPVQPVVPVSKPLIPTQIQPSVPWITSVIAGTPIFEVTRPNLPVLPFGASFQSPVLQQGPAASGVFSGPHFRFITSAVPATPHFLPQPGAAQPVIPPALVPQPVIPPAVVPQAPVPSGLVPRPFIPQPIPQPFFPQTIPQPALPPPVLPQPAPQPALQPAPQPLIPPGSVVEFHGTKNFIATRGQVPGVLTRLPFLPQTPVNAVQPIFPPELPSGHVPVAPNNQPNFVNTLLPPNFVSQGLPNVQHVFEQQPPFVEQKPQEFQPQVPQHYPGSIFQQQLPVDNEQQHEVFQQNHNIVQQELPNNQVTTLFSEQFPVGNSNDQHHVIQPGNTDVQLPAHLPNHPNFFANPAEFDGGNFHDPQQHPDNVFRPSVSLEPPYKKK